MTAPRDREAPRARSDDRRRQLGDERRERIIQAAVRRFADRGFAGARIADIAKDAGVTDAGLIHHFPTKLSLFFAIVDRREQAYAPDALQAVTTVRSLFDWQDDAVRRAAHDPDYVRFRAMLSGSGMLEDHPMGARLRENLRLALVTMVPVVQAGIDSGEILPHVDAKQVVLELLALNEGIRDQWVTLPEEIDYVRVFTTATAGLYARISGREPEEASASPEFD